MTTLSGKLAPGVIIDGRYAVDRKIGAGAFAEVWLGRRIVTGERVALKRIHGALLHDEEVIERLRREAYFLARVVSEHVVKINELLVDPAFSLVLVMEYVEGHLLSSLMEGTILSVEEAVDLGIDLLRGLRDLHAVRIIHRDLKPSNIILRPAERDGYRAVIFDFSLSRLARRPLEPTTPPRSMTPPMQVITRMNVTLGTLEYMSPEQLLDSRSADERSDLYSLASILYTAVAGEHPFAEFEGPRELARAKLEREAPPLAVGRSDQLAVELEGVIAKGLSRRPQERHLTAAAMLEDLLRLRGMHGDWPQSSAPRSADLVKRGSVASVRASRRVSSGMMGAVRVPSSPPSTSSVPPAPSSTSLSSRPPLRPTKVIMVGAAVPSEPELPPSLRDTMPPGVASSPLPVWEPIEPPRTTRAWARNARMIAVVALSAILAGLLVSVVVSRATSRSPADPTGTSEPSR